VGHALRAHARGGARAARARARRASDARGWWKAPIRFLPAGTLTAVLPPTDESTIAIIEVGTWKTGTPRR
jgi:hypothetical protein